MEDWELLDQHRRLTIAGWALSLIACGIAAIPFVGVLSWIVAGPLLLATFVLAIVLLTKGVIGHGVSLLFMSMLVAPVIVIGLPILIAALHLARSHPDNQSRLVAPTRQFLSASRVQNPPSVGSRVIFHRPVRVNIPAGEVIIPSGAKKKILKVSPPTLYVDYNGYSVPVPQDAVSAIE